MQCAARSSPHQRSRSPRRPSTSFEPTESVDAASRRRSSIAKRPANAPKAPTTAGVAVEATALRRRSTIASAVASDTPAAAYVCSGEDTRPSLAIRPEAVTGVARLAGDRGRRSALARRATSPPGRATTRQRSRRSSPTTARTATTRSAEPLVGSAAIAADWLKDRDAPGSWEAEYRLFAVDGDPRGGRGRDAYPQEASATPTPTCSSSPPTAAAARSPSGSSSSGIQRREASGGRPARTAASCGRRLGTLVGYSRVKQARQTEPAGSFVADCMPSSER